METRESSSPNRQNPKIKPLPGEAFFAEYLSAISYRPPSLLVISAMEPQGAAGKAWTPKLTLESYLNLNNLDNISTTILRKIITMHGFNSVKVPKDDLMDAVASIKLMDAHHSTLENELVCSDAFLGLNDVIEDLSDIHWQECCVTSIQTINSTIDFSSRDIDDVAGCSAIVIDNGHKKKKSKLTAKPPVLFTYARRDGN